jgi:hypothetical protein
MNAGLSSLTALKAAVLPESLRTRTGFNDTLVLIGLGVAAMMEGYLARSLQWSAAAVDICGAQCLTMPLTRFPLYLLTSVEIQSAGESTWTTITDDVQRLDKAAGLIHFSTTPGGYHDALRATYQGGYYWDTTEDASGTLPTGATALPSALKLAWIAQTQAIVEAMKLTNTQAATGKDKDQAAMLQAELLPAVKTMLAPFRRMS